MRWFWLAGPIEFAVSLVEIVWFVALWDERERFGLRGQDGKLK